MRMQLRPIGQRRALVLDDALLEQLGITEDTVLELTLTDDGEGIVIRRSAPPEEHRDSTQWFTPIQARESPAVLRLLDHLRAHRGAFFSLAELPAGRRVIGSSPDGPLAACGRAAFLDAEVVLAGGRIGCLPEGSDSAAFAADWPFRPARLSRSDRAAAKDAIVLRLLAARPGEPLAREEVYERLHREWRGEGGILQRDADACAARLAMTDPRVSVVGGRLVFRP